MLFSSLAALDAAVGVLDVVDTVVVVVVVLVVVAIDDAKAKTSIDLGGATFLEEVFFFFFFSNCDPGSSKS